MIRVRNICLLLIIPFLTACKPQPSGMIDIDRHALWYEIRGTGSPVVVVDVGLGETYGKWESLLDSLASTTRIFVYDRAGYGRSEAGPEPRNAGTESGELHTLLHRARIKPPYLLLGHSLGAANLQVFASNYPKEVAGMVLLDPPPRDWLTGKEFPDLRDLFLKVTDDFRVKAIETEQLGDTEAQRKAAFFRTLASEQDNLMKGTASELDRIENFGSIPLTVIASDIANPQFGASAEAYQEFWKQESQELAALSGNGKFILAKGSTHQIPGDAPEVVIGAVRDMIGK